MPQRFAPPQPHPSDITGRRAVALTAEKADHEAVRERAVRDLNEGHGFVYIESIPGYGTYPIPKDVYLYLERELKR